MGKRKFTAILLPESGGGYRVLFPYHPDCFVWGDSIEEALERSKDSILTHLEGLAEEGLDLLLEFADVPHIAMGEVEVEIPQRLLDISRDEQQAALTSGKPASP